MTTSFLSILFALVAVCFVWAVFDEVQQAEYPTSKPLSNPLKHHRDLLGNNEDDCTEIPMETIQSTWDWARKKRFTVASTGMMVYQNGNKLFEQYEPANVCPIFCLLPPIRWAWNTVNQFGGSPTKRFSLWSGTKSLAGLAVLMLVKQEYLRSLDEPVSEYIAEWKGNEDKARITFRELLSLSSGIRSTWNPFKSIQAAIDARFIGKQYAYGMEPYALFSHIIELTTGRSGSQYLDEEVFSPLGISVRIGSFGYEEVTNFFGAGATTLPDAGKLAQEIMAAALGEGKLFTQQDIEQLAAPGLLNTYGLSFWLSPYGIPSSCDPEAETVYNIIGAFSNIITIFPKKRLIFVNSAGWNPSNPFSLSRRYWNRLYEGVGCECARLISVPNRSADQIVPMQSMGVQ